MLFDLRGRGRRRTVQGVYLGLALLMGGGLVLFGVGTGNGIGGLLNGIGNGGSGSSKPVVSQTEKTALRQTQLDPSSPSAWEGLVKARYEEASQDSSSTGTYTSAGLAELQGASQAWQKYLSLTKTPDWTLAELMAQAYSSLGNFADEADAWQIVTAANPTQPTYYQDLAAAAWQAKNNRLGDLAEAKALDLTPKAQQAETKASLQKIKAEATAGTSTTSAATPSSG